ncbi:hypothetical protein [Maribacter sp. 2210JD10-5]|uniref:hypothetical protein n=1 Tax=Maribacter sp. 2210JD10-5 TaxID=3386272 RepID=UPI0039BD6EE1
MKNYISIILCGLLLVTSCKTEKKEPAAADSQKELTVLEKVAQAHGYDNWGTVSEIKYTFNVDRDSSHFERSWNWKPKSNEVKLMTRQDTVSYTRNAIDSTLVKTDGGFINDKFWLLGPYQLIWDSNNFTYEHEEAAESPISKEKMHKLSIVYGNEGGYTPGDAYDFYFGNDYIIKEWVFRKGNQEDPSMVTSWEDYKTISGMKIATMHKMPESNFQLYFSGIEIE